MAGTVLAAAIVMTVGAAAVGIGALSGAAVTAQAVTGAADNAALAAADVALGLAPGDPCAEASRIVDAFGARLRGCELLERPEGTTVTVVVEARFGVFPVTVKARAGNASQ